jgi:aryl-alcohol dehydrogenase-like predicted oxidoreductase
MEYRGLGRAGLEVSEVGYGAWGIGGSMWLGADDRESLRALNRALELGVTLIDTALGYGDGHSEQLVGRAVREHGGEVVVATKIPPKNRLWPAPEGIDPDEAFPADHVRACVERSLRNTGLDVLDVEQFHVWSDEWTGRGSWQEAIAELKDEGKIRAFGVSINTTRRPTASPSSSPASSTASRSSTTSSISRPRTSCSACARPATSACWRACRSTRAR